METARLDGGITALPGRDSVVEVGSTPYVVVRPEGVRAFENDVTTVEAAERPVRDA